MSAPSENAGLSAAGGDAAPSAPPAKMDAIATKLVDGKHMVASKVNKGKNRVLTVTGAKAYLAKKAREGGDGADGENEDDDWEMEGVRVPAELIQGTVMRKISDKGKGAKERLFRLDADQGKIYWDSRKRGVIFIENIKELRLGSSAHAEMKALLPTTDFSKVEDRWLTIIYTIEDDYKVLHVLAPTPEILNKWHETVSQIRTLRLDFMGGVFHSASSTGLELWERHHFAGADTSKDELLSFKEIKVLCRRLNFGGSETELRRQFLECAKGALSLDRDGFREFVKRLRERPDIAKAYDSVRGSKEFDLSVFKEFMKVHQKSRLSPEELETLYRMFAHGPKESKVSESRAAGAATTASGPLPPWTLDAFTAFLLSGYNNAFTENITPVDKTNASSQADKVCQDMTQPLSSYFMCSSHNTYLVGNQLVGSSSVEGYVRALLGGCRTVEMDVYDGPAGGYADGIGVTMSNNLTTEIGNLSQGMEEGVAFLTKEIESMTAAKEKTEDAAIAGEQWKAPVNENGIILGEPIVTHGGTLTSSISVRRICEAIDRYAFVASQYPVIISAEIHCSIEQQKVLVRIMREVFGDKLLVAPIEADDGDFILPSPDQLKDRILLKAKNKFLEKKIVQESAGVPVGDEEEDAADKKQEERQKKTSEKGATVELDE